MQCHELGDLCGKNVNRTGLGAARDFSRHDRTGVPSIPRNRLPKALAFALFIVVFAFPPGGQAAEDTGGKEPLVFGFLPIISTERLIKRFEPMVDYLASEIGVAIRIETAEDYREFHARTVRGKNYDFLFTAPHFYYLAHRKSGYRIAGRVDLPSMAAIIVVRADSPIRDRSDLCGKQISTPDPLSLARVLIEKHIKSLDCKTGKTGSLVFTPSHNASLLSAYNGLTDAGGLMKTPFRRAAPNVRENVRIISETTSTPHMPISVAPWVAPKTARAFTRALVGMTDTKRGKQVLRHMKWPGFVTVDAAEYDFLREHLGGLDIR